MDEAHLEAVVTGWLVEGPASIAQLAARAVEAGILAPGLDEDGFEPEDYIDALNERTDAWWTISSDDGADLLVATRSFTDDGLTFTHRVTAAELEADAVLKQPDLVVLFWEHFDGLDLADGSGPIRMRIAEANGTTLTGPTGWLDGIEADDLVAFTRTDERVSLRVVADADLADPTAELEALRAGANTWIPPGRGMEEVPFILDALCHDHALFHSPVPPVVDLLAEIGLERRGHEWGPADEPWHTFAELLDRNESAIRDQYRLDRCCDRAFERLETAWRAFSADQPVDGAALADDLDHGAVPEAFAHVHAETPTSLVGFADTLVASSPDRHAAPAHVLAGLARLRAADPVAALESFERAVHADPAVLVGAEWLARLEMDRGNVDRAATVAVRAGADEELTGWIANEQARRRALRPNVGRNDRCPCGSGRKFKQCCARKSVPDLVDRVPFVLQRMGHFATGPDGHEVTFSVMVAAADRHDDLPATIRRFATDPFLVDVTIHEGGLGVDYVDQRGPLLPDDEVALLEAVLSEPRRLFEITDVSPGESLTLRDTATGAVTTARERSGSLDRSPGELLFARMLTVDGTPVLFGVPLAVPLVERDRVLALVDEEADAESLAEWYGSLFLPPRMTNREGEDLVFRRTVCAVDADSTTIEAVLDDTFGRDGAEPMWHDLFDLGTGADDGPGEVIVRGTLRMEEVGLVVESNSRARQDRLLEELDELFEYDVIDDTTRAIDEVAATADERDGEGDDDGPGFGFGSGFDLDEPPAEVRAAVETQMHEYERRWVDESIPALGGLTPNQALEDPTRREDLFALLRDMHQHEPSPGWIGMSVHRIEQHLGIEQS